MRTLYLLRHAKSSWKDDSLRDFDRPLKGRGREAAEQIGQVLAAEKLTGAALLVIGSPAVRARETTQLVLQSAGLTLDPRFDERIYEADVPALLEVVSSIPDSAQTAMLVGHNPGMEGTIRVLTGEAEPMPTAAIAIINLEIDSWKEISAGTGKLQAVVRPRDEMEEN